MNILGINEGHMSSACLIKNGKIVAAVCEERFTRNKNEQGYPTNAIKYCLEAGNITKQQIDCVATATEELQPVLEATKRYSEFTIKDYLRENKEYWKPKLIENKEVNYFELFPEKKNQNYDLSFLEKIKDGESYITNEELSKLFKKERIENLKRELGISEDKIFFVDHHTGHAHYAYFMSPFRENVLVLTADAWGDGCNSSIWIGNKNNLQLKHKSPDNSLARIYRNITLLLGMKPNEHEYKVMGLAPYSTNYQSDEPYEIFKKTLYVDGIDFKYHEKPSDNYFWFKERLDGFRFDGIAGGLQRFTEEVMIQWVTNSLKQFGLKKIVLSGGLALNIKVNKAISEIDEVNEFFVPSAGGDESQSIGAALYIMNKFEKENEFHEPTHDYHGPEIDDSSLTKLISEFNLEANFEIKQGISNLEIAEFLKNNLIVARCVGRSEFGPRALGNRSILANPSNIENLKKINTQIKYRDFWMPFTPSILTERIPDYIKNPKELKSPFMTIGFDSTVLAQKDLIAAIHPSDQTVRPQFVNKEDNPEYYDLIKEFESLTGIGGLLNTSLNLHGEPIVSNSSDAIHTLINSDLDILVINKTAIIRKKK
tara:strand:+ start:822 stop:2612 length:1791 start_codon:yes stop_codon:yes gene_type:complete